MKLKCCSLLISIVIATACNSDYQPKPQGYFAIQLPTVRTYTKFTQPNYPYTFEYANDAVIEKDSSIFDTETNNNDWINISYPKYNCKIYISYNSINGSSTYKKKDPLTGIYKDSIGANSFEKLKEDAFNLTSKHIYKSTDIKNEIIHSPNNINGILFKAGGDAASPIQFFMTDSVTHFLRGAMYYDAQPKEDSTRPVTAFVLKDIQHLFNTLQWQQK